MDFRRPGTLRQVLQLAEDAGGLRVPLAEFLDEFYMDADPESRLARLLEAPARSSDQVREAFFGGIAEHLCRRWGLGPAPEWSDESSRFLNHPFFMGPERMKPILLAESPSAFRRRFIFTEAEPLRRARMPRDLKWWAYESERSGLLPSHEDLQDAQEISGRFRAAKDMALRPNAGHESVIAP